MSGVSPSARNDSATAPAPRVHRMRVARGACWVIVAASVGAVALILLDATFRLPGWVRGLGLASWLTGVGVLVWRRVLRPWRETAPADDPTPTPTQELPGNLTAAAAAALALVGCLVAGTFVPGAPEHLRRVAFPWQKNPGTSSRVIVTSGDPVIRRGDAVSLTAYIERPAPASSATFVWHDSAARRETRIAVAPDASGTFYLRRAGVKSDFRYRIETGDDASEWYTVTALDPVELTDGSTTTVHAPKYAPKSPARVLPGLPALDGFANGTAEFRFRFNRATSDAFLEFRSATGTLEVTRVTLAGDRLSGTANFVFKQSGALRLVLVNEEHGKKLRTETAVPVRVQPDEPPRFTLVSGISPRPMRARPDAVLRIACGAADDVAVGDAVLEYTLESFDSRTETISIPLAGGGTLAAHGTCDFPLAGKGRAGETIRFRLRISDTRRIDETGLMPQAVHYPATEWAVIQLDAGAPSSEDQEVTGRRDAVRHALGEAMKEVRQAVETVEVVQAESEEKPALAPEHTSRLNNARENARTASEHLRAAAREAALNPELREIATYSRDTAERFLRVADDPLRRAATDTPADRATSLATGLKHLGDALERIEQLLLRNERVARDRLDVRALAEFAAGQAVLAERCATLPPAETAKRQRELFTRFQQLLVESEPLRTAVSAAKQQEFDRLAASASDLAGAVREWNLAAQRLHTDARARLLDTATADQRALAVRVAALLDRGETAARVANVALPRLGDFRAITDLIAAGKLIDAMREMVLLANALDSMAATFEKWTTERSDPKAAVRQLALWQDDLRARFRTATGGNAATFATLPGAAKRAFRTEQAALRATVAALVLPPGDKPRAARAAALEQLELAQDLLNGTGANADRALDVCSRELNRLAAQIPTVAERLTRTRNDFGPLWREQGLLLVAAEQAIRNTTDAAGLARKLAPLHDQQQRLLGAFEALDLPGVEARRVRVTAALVAAVADLRDNLPLEVLASQKWAQRELDRVKNLLTDGVVPPDDRAEELARRAAATEKAIQTLGAAATATQLQVPAAEFQDLLRLVNQLPASLEAATLLLDARETVQHADLGFRNGSKPDEVLRRVRLASVALTKLADRYNGTESEVDRIRRLAEYRRAGAVAAEQFRTANLPPNPTLAAEIARQLGREIDELAHARVGAGGQALRKRLDSQYSRLKEHATPERVAGLHAGIAEGLDELAGLMADLDDLAATFDRKPPSMSASGADAFLPSRAFVNTLRDLSRDYRTLHAALSRLPEELVQRTKPTDAKALAAAEKQQRELLAEVVKFAERLAPHSASLPTDPGQTAELAKLVADRLHDGGLFAARDAAERLIDVFRLLANATPARGAAELAARQEAILKLIHPLLASPGIATAQQRLRGTELEADTAGLVQTLERTAREAGPGEQAQTLTGAATEAKTAGRSLADAAKRADAGKADEAAQLRGDAEARLRAAAGKVAGAGATATTLPALDPEVVATGDALRRAERAMRNGLQHLDEKPDLAAATKVMSAAGDALRAAAKEVGERLVPQEQR